MEAVKITNLSKYYGKNRGIVDLDLTVPKGEFFGFIGPNGAGKSTTIRTLLGLIAPSGGNAKIFGMDIVKDKQAILQRVGYLPSEAAFPADQNILNNPADFHSSRLPTAVPLHPSRQNRIQFYPPVSLPPL